MFFFIVLMLALPATAHSRAELDAWMEEWSTKADYALSPALLADWADMSARHPWYFDPQPTYSISRTSSGTNRSMGSNVEQWRPLVASHFAADKVDRAMCIMAAESGGNPNAKNPRSTAAGLFQFLRSTWDNMVPDSVTGGSYASGQVYQPEANIRSAAWLQNAAGWTQWSPYNRGMCR